MEFSFSPEFKALLTKYKTILLIIVEFQVVEAPDDNEAQIKRKILSKIDSKDLEWWLEAIARNYNYDQKGLSAQNLAIEMAKTMHNLENKGKFHLKLWKTLEESFNYKIRTKQYALGIQKDSFEKRLRRAKHDKEAMIYVEFGNNERWLLNPFLDLDKKSQSGIWSDLFEHEDGLLYPEVYLKVK